MKRVLAVLSLIALVVMYGCGGSGSSFGGGGGTVTPPATYSISGQVTQNGVGLSGVTVTATSSTSGSVTATAQTDSSGHFTIANLKNGVYTLSAALTGYIIITNQSVTVNGAIIAGITFTATAVTSGPYVVDTFQGTGTTTPLQDHTGDSGAGWQVLNGPYTLYIDGPNSAVYSSADANYYSTATLPVTDYSIIAKIHMNIPASGNNCYVSGRVDPTSHGRFVAGHTHGLGWGLYYIIDAGETRLAPLYGDQILSPNTDYTVELRIVGSSIMMFVNNVLAASATADSTLTTGNHTGLEMTGNGPGTSSSYEVLDYTVTDPSSR